MKRNSSPYYKNKTSPSIGKAAATKGGAVHFPK